MNFLENKRDRFVFHAIIVVACVFALLGLKVNIEAGILVVTCDIFFISTYLYTMKYKYKGIVDMADMVSKILHDNTIFEFTDNEEGEIAILESEIKKMSIRLLESAYLLQKEKDHLEDSIADISHQLRTPLTTINMLVSFMQKEDLSVEDRIKYVMQIKSHLSRVDWLIGSLLRISKLDAGTVVMREDQVRVEDVISKSVEPILISMELREQLFDYVANGGETFKGDLNWTVEAVSNILKNCMEHTAEGGHVRVKAKENILYTAIIITDTGTGMSEEDIAHIFERFYVGKSSSESSIGIGMALAKKIVHNQNGTIKVENRKSGGSRFTIKFYKGVIDGTDKN